MNAPDPKGDSWGGLGFRCITIYHKEEKQCLKFVRVYFKCVRVCFNMSHSQMLGKFEYGLPAKF